MSCGLWCGVLTNWEKMCESAVQCSSLRWTSTATITYSTASIKITIITSAVNVFTFEKNATKENKLKLTSILTAFYHNTYRSYSTLGPVSACLGGWPSWTGKPPGRRTRHPGLLSLSLTSVAGWMSTRWKLGQ